MSKIREALDNRIQKLKINHKIGSRDIANKEILDIASFLENHILPLLPQPRTEQEILKDFEKLGYLICSNDEYYIILELDCRTLQCKHSFVRIYINKQDKYYVKSLAFETIEKDYIERQAPIAIQEHKLLSELFAILGWL